MAKRLSDFGNINALGNTLKLEDIENEEVTINKVTFGKGRYGEVAYMQIVTKDGEIALVITGGQVLLPALHEAAENQAFPMPAIFKKRGRAWIAE